MNIVVFELIFPKFLSKFFIPKIKKKKKFPNIFFSTFFSQNFFSNLFSIFFFLNGFSLDASPFTETKRTLCICVMKNMISKPSKLDFSLVWLFSGSYCSHHTRRKKFYSFSPTYNILLYFFQKCIEFWLEVDTPILLYNHSEASVKFVDFTN